MLRRIRTLAAVTLLILATLGAAAPAAYAAIPQADCLGSLVICP